MSTVSTDTGNSLPATSWWRVSLASLLATGSLLLTATILTPLFLAWSREFFLLSGESKPFSLFLGIVSIFLGAFIICIAPYIFVLLYGKKDRKETVIIAYVLSVIITGAFLYFTPNGALSFLALPLLITIPLLSAGKLKFRYFFISVVLATVSAFAPIPQLIAFVIMRVQDVGTYWGF